MNVAYSCCQAALLAGLLLLSSPSVSAQSAGRSASSSAPRASAPSGKAAKGATQPGQVAKMPAFVEGRVDFKLLRNTGKYPTLQVEVPVKAFANAKLLEDATAVVPNPDWVDKIKVTVTLAFENKRLAKAAKVGTAEGKDKFIFYRASATILTMHKNDLGTLNFFLPGELLKRDNITQAQPYAYMVDIVVDGVQAEPSKAAISPMLQNSPADLEAFNNLAAAAVGETAGMFVNQLQVGANVPSPRLPVTLVREDSTR